ncbi:CBS domain-containing protein [Dictyobacter vulcani]|nr:CBS domain-containing protein [Dictyobacter vulcani]
MIVRDVMSTKLTTVEPDDTLAHAANLFRQYGFHNLPVTRRVHTSLEGGVRTTLSTCEGLLYAQDIDLAAAVSQREDERRPWQERRVVELMHSAAIRVTPAASVAAAAQMLVERGLSCLPVVEYKQVENEVRSILVGLLTRSDLLLALSRSMGAFEPGMQLDVALPHGNMVPLARTLALASELRVHIRSVQAAPLSDGTLDTATLRLGTINPMPLLIRLKEEGIQYSFGSPLAGSK